MNKVADFISGFIDKAKPTVTKLVGGLSKAGNFLTSNHETIGNVLNTFGNVLGSLAPGDANNKLRRLAQGISTTGQSIKDNDNIFNMFGSSIRGILGNRLQQNRQPAIIQQRPQNQQFGITPVQTPIQQPPIAKIPQKSPIHMPQSTSRFTNPSAAKGAFGNGRKII